MLRNACVATLALTVLACRPTSDTSPGAQTPAAATRRTGELRSEPSTLAVPSWGTTAPMAQGRFFHTATLLSDGKVLVAGGFTGTTSLTSTAVYNPATGTWTATGPLATNRYQHTATLLPNGKVLVLGGYGTSGFLSSAELFDPASGAWSAATSMTQQRVGHTATLLPHGKVLVVGGSNGDPVTLAEVYDPATNTWASAGSLAQGRFFPTATLLPSGKVLVAAGTGLNGYLTSSEVYDPASNTWSPTGALTQRRYQHTATLLPNGKVLLAGGRTSTALNNADLYDPATGTWTAVSPLSKGREYSTATLLPDGKVLLVGGEGANTQAATTEVYDPATNTWTVGSPLTHSSYGATATLLPGGKVFVAGGYDVTNNTGFTSAHLYDPGASAWSTAGSLTQARYSPTATVLPGGRVLVVGGYDGATLGTAELYDPATVSWTPTSSPARPRYLHSATLLLNGKVLIAGGNHGGFVATAELYDPATGAWSPTGSLARGRDRHTATLLPNGKVLVAGGYGVDGLLLQAEVYDPTTGAWSAAGSLLEGRDSHAATLLPSGKVLVAGGYGTSSSLASAALYDPATNTWSATGSLLEGRSALTMTLLPSGKVLVVGGYNNGFLASAELYTPATGTWSPTASLAQGRDHHSATLLPSGQVLVVGGYDNGPTASAELYDPATSTWTATSPLFQERDHHLATLLTDGRVLVAGGFSSFGFTSSAELYAVSGATPAWRPSITSISPSGSLSPGSVFTVNGARFRGISEASSGSTWSSATDLPLLTLMDLERGRLFPVPFHGFSSTQVTATVPDVPAGHYLLSVTVNALTSSQLVTILRDVTEPETTLTETPASVTRQTDATFRFEANEAPSTFTCSLDGAPLTSCTSPHTYANLTAGNHTFQVRARDAAGNVDASPASFTWSIDLTAPDTSLATTPANPTHQRNASFAFSSEAGATFACSLDGAAFTACTSPTAYFNLTAGNHTFQVRAQDTAGNVDATPASFSWTVDLTAPDTTLTSTPPLLTGESSATFGFFSEAGATFECSLDGAAFSACTSPVSYSSLAEGTHTFQVRARDAVGNVDASAAAFTWSIDLTAPDTTLTSTPPDPTSLTHMTFTFSANEAGSSFECSLDGAAFIPCTVPAFFDTLTAGPHLFRVRARDAAGNVDGSPASVSWTIDVTVPETSITSAPSSPANQSSATFSFSTTKDGAIFECALDGAAFDLCTSPVTFQGLAEGPHVFRVRAFDAAGNVDLSPASHSWTVDLTAPETHLTVTPASPTHQREATFAFSSEAGATFECSLDGAAFIPCTSAVTYANLTEGRHTFQVRAFDAAGNVDPSPASHSWTLDSTAPAAPVITSPAQGATLTDNTPTLSGTAQPGSTVTVTLDGSEVGTVTADAAGAWSFTPASVLAEGEHTVSATASDTGGTSPASAPVRFTVDTTPDTPETPDVPDGGCGCAAGPGDASWMLGALALLGGVVSRRRRLLA